MADNKKKQDGRDDSRIDRNDPGEVSFAADSFGCSPNNIRLAIHIVGNIRKDVEWFVRTQTSFMIDLDKAGILHVVAITKDSNKIYSAHYCDSAGEAKIYLDAVDRNIAEPIGIWNGPKKTFVRFVKS